MQKKKDRDLRQEAVHTGAPSEPQSAEHRSEHASPRPEKREEVPDSKGSPNNVNDMDGTNSSGRSGRQTGKQKKKKWSTKKKVLVVLLVVLIVLAVLVCGALLYVMSKIDKINTVDRGYDNSVYDSIIEDPPSVENPNNEPDTPSEIISEEDRKIQEIIDSATPIKFSDDVLNILLIGTDARTHDYRGRSDSMILVSVNTKTKKVVMTSIMRDIYLSIPGKSNNRINAAYNWGGADLLIQTIEQHFKIRIDKFVQVDFLSFESVIESVGGVDIELTGAEADYMNNALGSTQVSAGMNHLNGKQALIYSRIRYIGNADFERTQRQRTVLQELMKSASKLSISEMNDCLDTILPLLTTDLTEGELLDLVLHAPTYLGYERVQLRIPANGTYKNMRVGGRAVLGIDFEENRNIMIEEIYG